MLTLKDLLDYEHFSAEELEVIMEHEHLPPIVALEKVEHFLGFDWGNAAIHQMILDRYNAAKGKGDEKRAREIRDVMRKFDLEHRLGYDRRTVKHHGRLGPRARRAA